jgi:hypothetical protein
VEVLVKEDLLQQYKTLTELLKEFVKIQRFMHIYIYRRACVALSTGLQVGKYFSR